MLVRGSNPLCSTETPYGASRHTSSEVKARLEVCFLFEVCDRKTGLHKSVTIMRTTFSISFFCRPSKANRHGEAPIECSIIICGERTMFNLPMKANPNEFNKRKQPQEIVDYLDLEKVKIKKVVNEMLESDIPVNPTNLREYIRNGGVKTYTVRQLFSDYLHILSKRVDADNLSMACYKKYDAISKRFLARVNPEAECTVITNALVKSFVTELYVEYDDSTAAGMATKLKTFIKFGIDNGRLQVNPFAGIKITKGWKPIEMLSDEDFDKVRTKAITIPRIEKVRDMFIFACGSGMAYCDLKELKPDDFQEVDGNLCVIKQRHKTRNTFVAVLLPWAVEVARKYEFDLSRIVISNQKANSYLGEIKDICGVTSVASLHTHLGRHYYCNHLLNKGIRPEVVAKAAGHSNYKTLLKHYARIEEVTTVKEITSAFHGVGV